jgi:tRNA threonylcarbamoyl adenosine modification protein YeaZ
MNYLYLDASRDRMSVALESGGSWFARESIDGRHDQILLETMQSICEDAGIAIRQVSHAVVVNGPGSFTGLRIAVSFVHALDLVRPLRVLPIDQLSLLGYMAKRPEGAIVDARMDEVYVGTDKYSDGTYQSLGLLPLSELISDQTWVCHADEAHRFDAQLIPVRPTIDSLRDLASQIDSSRWIDGRRLTPLYLRKTVSWKPLSEQPSKLYDH